MMMLNVNVQQIRRGGRSLLQDIELQFAASGFSVILGPNGAGKSTLLKLIAGQDKIEQGGIRLDGTDIHAIDLSERACRLAMLTQEHPLNFPFSVLDVVRMGCYPLGLSDEASVHKAQTLLKRMELDGLASRNYLTLSGGEKQRVQMARVLAQLGDESQLLLLDEPLTGMDLRHQHLTLDYLRQLAQTGLRVIAVLHDPLLAAQYADHLILLKQGRLKAEGDLTTVWNDATLSDLYDLPLRVSLDDGIPRLEALADNLFGT